MNDLVPLTIACGDYDRTRALSDGRVSVEGCRVNFLPLEPEEVFFALSAIRNSMWRSCRSRATASRPPGATVHILEFLPSYPDVFGIREIYVRKDAGIKTPQDLRGKRIGVPEYQLTALVWIRGMLQEEFGVKPSESTCVFARADQPRTASA